VIIAGPTEVKVPPVAGATLLISYQKGSNEGGEETNLIVAGTPALSATPISTSTPTVTPAPTPAPTLTPTPAPTATPRPTRTPRPP
jgi:hypothetical protein